jgi:ribonuclease BN (tRNA processing enzyme)
MIKITHLGTCSGTEPIKNLHHNSIVLEVNGVNYWFDAGENCAHYAHTSGIDVMKTKALFISHCHIDHTGGMPLIFNTMRKMFVKYNQRLISNDTLKVFIPRKEVFDATFTLLNFKERKELNFEYNPVKDGVIFEDENVKVTAYHNQHLHESGENGWHSFSYLIEAEGKRIVFSGDVGCPYELNPLLEKPCDLLMHETGHHKVKDVLDYAKSKNVKRLRFIHHGREILNNQQKCIEFVNEYSKKHGINAVLS